MRGASRASLAELRERLTATSGDGRGDGAVTPDARAAARLGGELFAVVHLLDRQHSLRRTLSDPAKPPGEKVRVVRALLAGRVAQATEELAAAAVALRWSSPRDLADAVEQLAVIALVMSADAEGTLDDLEDGLFRFGRVVDSEPRLRAVLSDPTASPEGKHDLLTTLLEGKVAEPTLRLIDETAQHPRGRSLDANLEQYARLAAGWRQRLIAAVRTATELSGDQRNRLAAALGAVYGRQVHLNVVLDPGVIGGLSVQVGDEVIDGTVASRLETVRRRLAG